MAILINRLLLLNFFQLSLPFHTIPSYTLSSPSMGLTLPTLATELVELVSHFLERNDLLSLRLVNKKLHQKSFSAFHALFTTIRTDLSLISLEKIQAVCTHGLNRYVKNLLLEAGEDGKFGHGAQWSRHSLNHLDMLSPGPKTLQHLLTNDLVNCRSFHIRIPRGMEDESHAITPSDVVGLILLLIPSLPTTSPVSSFAVSSRSHGTRFLDVKRLPMAHCDQAPFLRAWTHVQELMLEQTLTPETFAWSLNLVLHAPNLHTLSLNLGFGQGEAFMERLCAAESAPCFLESLSLRCGHTTVAHMSHLIERSRGTLRALSLEQVSLSRFGDWLVVLERLKSQAVILESISVHWLTAYGDDPRTLMVFPSLVNDDVVPGSGGRSVTWRTKRWKGEKRIVGANYRGPGVNEALKMLVGSAEAI